MSNHGSLQRRAYVAVALTIGFYALALASAGALLFAAFAMVAWTDTVYVKLVLFCVVGAGVILWAIFPRADKFEAPGPRLEPEQQPELFAVLRDVAGKTRQQMPEEVYLIPDVNAYVSHRGGAFAKRRVMGLGLTLMESVTVPQFRAIVAHEFGHYANDDTKYGAWIYKTREALDRTIRSLEQHSTALDVPFRAYGKLFVRVTQAISRAQELAADRLAAAVTSAEDFIAALITVRRTGAAYMSYIDGELAPMLSLGYRPPMARGFAAFVTVPSIAKALDETLAETLANEQTEEDDTHPPLRERIEALGVDPNVNFDQNAPRAVSLLRDLASLEASLVTCMWSDPSAAAQFQVVSWEEAGPRVYVPWWKSNATQYAEALRGITPPRIADVAKTLVPDAPPEDREAVIGLATHVAGAALAARLHDLGWMCEAAPGKPVAFTRDGVTVEPFNVVTKLHCGELSVVEWSERCQKLGLTDSF